jgi:hypothetical protein
LKTHRLLTGICLGVLLLCSLASADSQAPAPTPGQAVSVREGDTWSSATYVKKEGRRFLIRYDDGTQEWITADRLRASGDATPAGTAPAVTLEGPFTPVHLRPGRGTGRRFNAPVLIKPTTRPAEPFTDLTPATAGRALEVDQLLICPDTPNVCVAVGRSQGDDTPLMCIDTEHPGATQVRVLTAHEHKVIAAANGGQMLITQPRAWGSLTLSLWQWRDGKYNLQANYSFVVNGKNQRPDWACLLSPTHLLIRGGSDDYLIDLRSRQQVAHLQSETMTLHCSGDYLLTNNRGAALIVRASDLSIVAELPNVPSSFCLDPTGTYVATTDGHTLTVSKLAGKVQLAQARGLVARSQAQLLNSTALLIGGRIYYDLKTGIPVWKYNLPGGCKFTQLANGQILFVYTHNGQTHACMAALPDAAAAAALGSAAPEKFVISPGAHIALAGNLGAIGNAAEARKNLESAITAAGHTLDDAATQFKLTLTTAAGPTQKLGLQVFQKFGPPLVREFDAPSTIVTAVLTKDGEKIWQQALNFNAAGMLSRRPGQSIEQAAADAAKPDPDRLSILDIPGYLIKQDKAGAAATLGESTLTPAGFSQ